MQEPEAKASKTLVFKTPQELIHIRHGISLLQYKYWLLMLKAYREDHVNHGPLPEGEMCFLARSRLEAIFGYQPRTSDIEDDLEEMRKEPISFNILEKDGSPGRMGTGFINTWFVSGARIGVMFPAAIKRAVEDLDNNSSIFQLLNWQIFNSFNGKYEAIIYKLCKDYLGIGGTPYLTLDKFRDYVGLKSGEYPEFKHLNRWVISGPLLKINNSELADVVITVEFKKLGKKVVGLRFLVVKKHQQILDFGDSPCFKDSRTPINRALQLQYLDIRSPSEIEACIERVNIYALEQEKLQKVVNYSALYRRAIAENWGEESKNRMIKQVEVSEQIDNVEKAKISVEVEKRKQNKKNDYLNHLTSRAVNEMGAPQREIYASEFLGIKSEPVINNKTFWFDDKYENNKFKIFLRSKVKIVFEEEAYKSWLKAIK